MKRFFISLMCSIFIAGSFSSSLFAQEEQTTTPPPEKQKSSVKTRKNFNVKFLLGAGKIWTEAKVEDNSIDDPTNRKKTFNLTSDWSVPTFSLSLFYRLFWRIHLGLSYDYERFDITSELLDVDGKMSIDEFKIHFAIALSNEELSPYLGMATAPVIKVKDATIQPKEGYTVIAGIKYDINDRINVISQLSYEVLGYSTEKIANENPEITTPNELSIKASDMRIEFGVGLSM